MLCFQKDAYETSQLLRYLFYLPVKQSVHPQQHFSFKSIKFNLSYGLVYFLNSELKFFDRKC